MQRVLKKVPSETRTTEQEITNKGDQSSKSSTESMTQATMQMSEGDRTPSPHQPTSEEITQEGNSQQSNGLLVNEEKEEGMLYS